MILLTSKYASRWWIWTCKSFSLIANFLQPTSGWKVNKNSAHKHIKMARMMIYVITLYVCVREIRDSRSHGDPHIWSPNLNVGERTVTNCHHANNMQICEQEFNEETAEACELLWLKHGAGMPVGSLHYFNSTWRPLGTRWEADSIELYDCFSGEWRRGRQGGWEGRRRPLQSQPKDTARHGKTASHFMLGRWSSDRGGSWA